MNERHHSWLYENDNLDVIEVLDDWLGPTLAIISCPRAGQHALINLVAWEGDNLQTRIYGVHPLTDEVTQTYLANISRDYCDLSRKASETQALIGTARQTNHLILVKLPDLVVKSVSSGAVDAPFRDWQAIAPNEFSHWHEILLENS